MLSRRQFESCPAFADHYRPLPHNGSRRGSGGILGARPASVSRIAVNTPVTPLLRRFCG